MDSLHWLGTVPARAVLPALLAVVLQGAEMRPELVRDGDFERPDLRLGTGSTPGLWVPFVHAPDGVSLEVAAGAGRDGSRGVRYTRTSPGSHNIHLDQVVPVTPDTVYEVCAWFRGDSVLQPVLSVATMEWRQLALVSAAATPEWHQLHLVFNSFANRQVRVEWFPGATGTLYTGVAGSSSLDDVSLTALEAPPETLRRAFDLCRPKPGDELVPDPVRSGPVGPALPLRPIVCRDGVLRYDDGPEVALWGVNFQTALSWEYNGRLKPLGIPLEPAALNRITDGNLAHLRPLGVGVLRLHLLPADFADGEGQLRDSVYLDVLDYLVSRCAAEGFYVYLTLVNDMKSYLFPDSFLVGQDRSRWLFDPRLVACTERYITALLQHVNRYNGRAYSAEPAIAVIEVMNEPDYPDGAALATDPGLGPVRDAFERWLRDHRESDLGEALFPVYRYETVRAYIDRMVAAIRGCGARQPVIWNLNWPQMIATHEDVFQAVADSQADGVSFCLYPGQADVPSPFWEHPMDLSAKNYLPYLKANYLEYHRLRWALGSRFAGKAKVVYEFETFYNQTTYLYPAMAALFRSLGVQIAPMWLYGLTPAAEYLGGSHYLNLYCTPRKAVSFRIAAEVFRTTPRYTPYPTESTEEIISRSWAVSFPRDLSLWSANGALMHSGTLDWMPFPLEAHPHLIVGCGSSPVLTYEGTGAYFLEAGDGRVDLTVLPDAAFIRPPWQRQQRRPWERTCSLDPGAQHPLTLRLPNWPVADVRLRRLEGAGVTDVPASAPGITFEATPGTYRVERP